MDAGTFQALYRSARTASSPPDIFPHLRVAELLGCTGFTAGEQILGDTEHARTQHEEAIYFTKAAIAAQSLSCEERMALYRNEMLREPLSPSDLEVLKTFLALCEMGDP